MLSTNPVKNMVYMSEKQRLEHVLIHMHNNGWLQVCWQSGGGWVGGTTHPLDLQAAAPV